MNISFSITFLWKIRNNKILRSFKPWNEIMVWNWWNNNITTISVLHSKAKDHEQVLNQNWQISNDNQMISSSFLLQYFDSYCLITSLLCSKAIQTVSSSLQETLTDSVQPIYKLGSDYISLLMYQHIIIIYLTCC